MAEPGRAGSHWDDPLELSEDEILDEVEEMIHRRDAFGRHRHEPIFISDDDSDDEAINEVKIEEQWFKEMGTIDLTDEESRPNAPRLHPVRNGPLDKSHASVSSFLLDQGIEIKVNSLVELCEPVNPFKADFLKVVSIHLPLHDGHGDVIIRGIACTRTRYLGGQLPRKLNELCMIYEVDEDDARDYRIQANIEVHPADIQPLNPRHFVITNRPFPECRFERGIFTSKPDIESQGLLVCRWKYLIYYKNEASRVVSKQNGCAIIHITEDEVEKSRYRISEVARLNSWRGGKVPGGSYSPAGPLPIPTVHVLDEQPEAESNLPSPLNLIFGQRYGCVDTFSGGGGASRGVQMAGVQTEIAVDHWSRACATYRKNFDRYGTKLYEMDIFDFLDKVNIPQPHDLLHMSPACQPYSPAHTVEGRDDDKNIAVLYSCTELVKKIRPRVFTLEQTFGLLHNRHRCFFNALVQGFTCHGYSVRWKIVNLATWGLPQARRRLIMIGACPGEKLPDFPSATHSSEASDGLLPYVSVREVLDRIGPACSLHDLDGVLRRNERPWDADGILPRTITTSGGQNYHYSGTRDFTYREYASLQGFPVWHRFVAPGIKKQIGNAFPPCVVRVLYDWLRKWLENVDGVEPASHLDPHDLVDLTTMDDFDDDDLGHRGAFSTMLGSATKLEQEVEEQKYLSEEQLQGLGEDTAFALAIKASLHDFHRHEDLVILDDDATLPSFSVHDDRRSTGSQNQLTENNELEPARRESLYAHFQGQVDEGVADELARRQSLLIIAERPRQHSVIDLVADEDDNVMMCVDGGQSHVHTTMKDQSAVAGDSGRDGSDDFHMSNDGDLSESDTDSATIFGDYDMDIDDEVHV